MSNNRIKKTTLIAMAVLLFLNLAFGAQTVRIKDVAAINGLEDLQLYGYGLVVGLDGSGDKSQTVFTTQTITNMLKNMGIELPKSYMRIRNVAAVMVTGTLNPFKQKGTRLDVTVSSLGDATSLEGGTLILTPLQGPDQVVYASAQGPIATGGYDVRNRGMTHIKKNHVLVGRIPDGAIVQKEYEFNVLDRQEVSLSLINPDFTSAVAMAEAINQEFRSRISRSTTVAEAKDAATVELFYHVVARDSVRRYVPFIQFLSMVENLTFEIESAAKVIVNERTGTIVAGGNVKISEIAVTHGGIKVEIVNLPEVIQPQPFSMGQAEIIPNPEMVVEETDAQMVVLPNTTTVTDLAQSLNSLGVSPRDVIAIFQAIKQAGALHGQLEIM
jgi:flagellar P-ring protein precursor FlgI